MNQVRRRYPDLVFTSIENIKSRVDEMASLKFNKIDTFNMIKEYPYLISLSFQKKSSLYK